MEEQMGQLIALLFLSREVAHRAHLKARGEGSYAAHVALNDFYDNILEHADAIAEALQGEYGILLDVPFLEDDSEGDIYEGILDTLKRHKKWLEDNRYVIVPKDQTSIQNLIDEATHTYQTVIYKLIFLK